MLKNLDCNIKIFSNLEIIDKLILKELDEEFGLLSNYQLRNYWRRR